MRSPFLRSSFMPCLLLGLGLGGCREGSPAGPDDALADEALPAACEPGKEALLRSTVQDHLRKIRVAQSNADLKMLTDNGLALDVLALRCTEGFDRACDAECAGQRASVHLFMASALPLLRSKSTPDSKLPFDSTEADQLKAATEGMHIIERALSKLPRQRGFGAAAGEDDKGGVGGFNQYIKSYALLQSLRAELQMVAGDVYYRRVSTTRGTAVTAVVNTVLGGGRVDAENKGDLGNAAGYYEQAQWTLLDARTSVPAELGSSPLFGPELNKLHDLTQQIGERLRSVREGKLYIGVDPSGFQGPVRAGGVAIDKLMEQIALQNKTLREVEGDLAGKMRDWGNTAEDLATRADQMAELQSSRAIDLNVHKMNQVREIAEARTSAIDRDITALERNKETIELEAQIAQARLDLQIAVKSLQNDLVVLEAKTEEDILDRKIEGLRMDLDVVRNAIDATLADFNFDMQVAALQQQRLDVTHNIGQEALSRGLLDAQRNQLTADLDTQVKELAIQRSEIEVLKTRRDEIVRSQAKALEHQIAATETQLRTYQEVDGLITKICAARADLGTKVGAALEAEIGCLGGGACAAGNYKELFTQLLTLKKARHATVKAEAEANIALLRGRIQAALDAIRRFESLHDQREAKNIAAAAALTVASALPVITFEASLPPAVSTTIDPVKLVEPALTSAKERAALLAEKFQFGYQVEAEISQLKTQLTTAMSQLAQADIETLITEVETQQALAELHVNLLSAKTRAATNTGEQRVQAIECAQQGVENRGALARTTAEIAALRAQLAVQGGERGVLDVQLQQQDARIAQVEAAIRKLHAQQDELAIRTTLSDNTRKHLEQMRGAIDAQLAMVGVYRTKVTSLVERRDLLQSQLMEHIDKVALKRIDVDATQAAYIRDAIQSQKQLSDERIAALQARLMLTTKQQDLNAMIGTLSTATNAALNEYRDKITGLMEQRPKSDTARQVIWDFEDLSARLTRGAAELLEYKRALLNSTNFYYNAYRYRYNMLADFVGSPLLDDKSPYIWTAADTTQRLTACASLGTSAQCAVESLANNTRGLALNASTFSIHANSPLFQDLLRNHRARFEFSQFGADLARSAELGSYVLWDALNMDASREMRVIGFYLGFPDLFACRPTNTYIGHTGLGYQGNSLVLRPPVSERPTISSPGSRAAVDAWRKAAEASWAEKTLSVMQLESRLADGQDGVMPFLGYPLRGVYEIIDYNIPKCLEKVTELSLTVVYAVRR